MVSLHTHTYMCSHTHASIHTYVHAQMDGWIYEYLYICACAHVYMHAWYLSEHMYACMYRCVPVCIYLEVGEAESLYVPRLDLNLQSWPWL